MFNLYHICYAHLIIFTWNLRDINVNYYYYYYYYYSTHIRIRVPTVNPNAYINRKKFHSLVTQVSVTFSCDQQMNYRCVAIINDALKLMYST